MSKKKWLSWIMIFFDWRATIDSIYISDQNLKMIFLHVKRTFSKIESRHSLYLKHLYSFSL